MPTTPPPSLIPSTKPIPSYRLHKPTGQAVVRLNGRDFYLGAHATPASVEKYNRLVSEWLTAGRQLRPSPAATGAAGSITIAEVCLRYLAHVDVYYRAADGRPTKEPATIRQAIRILCDRYERAPVADFGPLAFRAVRQAMIAEGWCRKYINKQMSRLKSLFKWAKNEQLIPPTAYEGIRDIPGLLAGRSDARESEPVAPVDAGYVAAVLPLVSAQVGAMIELQLLTGMRPGEVIGMRGRDLVMKGKIWTYLPPAHKTAHHGHTRRIWLGPKAQEIVGRFLTPDLAAPLFRPAAAEAARNEAKRAGRRTPLTPSALARRGRQEPRGTAGDAYTVDSYRRAIARACDAAFPPLPPLAPRPKESRASWMARLTDAQRAELASWRAAHRWHPHQLRHNAATEIRARYGIEAARVILGHRSAAITEVYAEQDVKSAERVMAEVG
jgi:integrase